MIHMCVQTVSVGAESSKTNRYENVKILESWEISIKEEKFMGMQDELENRGPKRTSNEDMQEPC